MEYYNSAHLDQLRRNLGLNHQELAQLLGYEKSVKNTNFMKTITWSGKGAEKIPTKFVETLEEIHETVTKHALKIFDTIAEKIEKTDPPAPTKTLKEIFLIKYESDKELKQSPDAQDFPYGVLQYNAMLNKLYDMLTEEFPDIKFYTIWSSSNTAPS